MNGSHWANNLRGISAATAHSFSQIRWCVLTVTWTLCANSVIEREGDRQRKGKRERETHWPCCCSPLQESFQSNCLLIASGPESQGQWLMMDAPLPPPSSTPIYVLNTPDSWTGDRGWWGGGKQNQEQHSLTWIQAGNSSLVETLHHFQLDLQPTAHRWKVDWEKGRGQTGRRTNSGQTQHLTHNHSHTIESWDLETGDAMTIYSECPWSWFLKYIHIRKTYGLPEIKSFVHKLSKSRDDDEACKSNTWPDLHSPKVGKVKKTFVSFWICRHDMNTTCCISV